MRGCQAQPIPESALPAASFLEDSGMKDNLGWEEYETARKSVLRGLFFGIPMGILSWAILIAIVVLFLQQCTPARAEEINMDAIMQIESSGNAFAVNKADDSVGLYQITPILLKEYNTFNKTSYAREDLFDASINYKISSWYLTKRIPQMLKHYGKPVTLRNKIIAYNCGIKCVIDDRTPEITKQYLVKYARLTK